MRDWKSLLKKLGFTEGEAAVYLAALELGGATVQDIAKKANVSRVTTYASIEKLHESGLISSLSKGMSKRVLYRAESPKRLIDAVAKRVAAMEETLATMKEHSDELDLLEGGEKPVVKYFEGPEALNAIQSDILATRPKTIDEFCNYDQLRKIYPTEERLEYFNALTKIKPRVRAAGISTSKTLTSPDPSLIFIALDDKIDNFVGDIVIYGDKVAISTLKGRQIAILIENRDIAKMFTVLMNGYFKNK
ncbi:MAG: HTH-type transcriptional regulator, sugar sensing transcriptional regulator [Patescibacteria group bacterium]|jgi:sugar-specific transcriptional regulator TrmB|nr:HTH-type transcriptional regulator, sugar sensing transcriptional regulator [Patescibacteria group bacterium]